LKKKALVSTVLLLAAGAVGVSDAAIKYAKGAVVLTWPGGQAEARANAIASGSAGGPFGETLPVINFLPPGSTPLNTFNGPWVGATDTEANNSGTNSCTATARYNLDADGTGASAKTIFVDCVSKGNAGGGLGNTRDGNSVAALGDTAIDMRFTVRIVPTGGTTANLILNGTALVQRTIAGPGVGNLNLIVYPDTVIANLDPTSSGAGAVFKGRLFVDKDGIEKADGGLAPGDFVVQLTTDRARVTATNVTKAISCPNSALLATMVATDSQAQAVPGHTPLMIGILSLLMAGVGFMALRRTRLTA
jgi:hypothetical protein